jgi:hypothetical protein
MSFKLQLVQEIERDSLQLQKRQRSMVFKIEQLLSNEKFGNFDWENKTPFTMSKSPEQKIMELEAKTSRETEVILEQAFVADKKAIILI